LCVGNLIVQLPRDKGALKKQNRARRIHFQVSFCDPKEIPHQIYEQILIRFKIQILGFKDKRTLCYLIAFLESDKSQTKRSGGPPPTSHATFRQI
jgi:hypothetical protein